MDAINPVKLSQDFNNYLQNTLEGKLTGVSWGVRALDEMTGRIDLGEITLIGAASGVGKSFFLGNLIDRIHKYSPELKIAVFTSELDANTYLRRQIFMRAGVWRRSFELEPQRYAEHVRKVAHTFIQDLTVRANLKVYGPMFDFAQLQKIVVSTQPDIVFIDYIQQFVVTNPALKVKTTSDNMPILAQELQQTSKITSIPFVVLAQLANYAIKEDNFGGAQASVFDFGKELHRAAHRALILKREKIDGVLSDKLTVYVNKSRDGETGYFEMQINPGYQLSDI